MSALQRQRALLTTEPSLQPRTLFSICPRVTIAVMRHHNHKRLGEEKVYFTHGFIEQYAIKSSKVKNLEAGDDAEATEEYCLLLPTVSQPDS